MLDKLPAQILARFAMVLLVFYPLAILAARFDLTHFRNSFLIFILCALLGFVVLVLAVLKLPRKTDGEAVSLVLAIVLTLVPLMILGSNIVKARSVPFMYDVTTDTDNPPALSKAQTLRGEGEYPVEYASEKFAQLQKEGYPDIQPQTFKQAPQQVLASVKQAAIKMGWEVVHVNDKQLPYTLEAVASSALFGFKDDVAIRISQSEAGTRLDMRSMSREGRTDLGANAERIRGFFNHLNGAQ